MAGRLDMHLVASGLFTDPSALSSAPEGALLVADNVVINREGIIEPRRGLQTDVNLDGSGHATGLHCKALIRHYDYTTNVNQLFAACFGGTDKLIRSDGTQITYAGAAIAMTPNEVHGASVRKNLYFTADAGILRLDGVTDTTATLSGTPIGSQGAASLITTGATPLPTANQWAYRAVFYRAVNTAKHFSAPSGRFTLTNGAGANRAASLVVPVPADLVAGDYLQVYRSKASGGVTTEANDELFLAIEYKIASGDVTAGSVTIEDHVLDADLGAALYTNAGVEGILLANYRPPKAKHVAEFNGMLFAANTVGWQRRTIQLVNTTSSGSTGIAWDTFTATATLSSPTLTAVAPAPTSDLVGRYVSDLLTVGPGAAGTYIPADAKITAIDGGALTITMDKNAIATSAPGTTFHAHAWIEIPTGRRYYFGSATSPSSRQALATASDALTTARALAHLVNTDTNAAADVWVNVAVASGTMASLNLESRELAGATLGVRAYPGAAWAPRPSASADDVTLDEETRPNRLMWSKPMQPEAFPLGYFADLGSEHHEIRALACTRDSLFVFKTDGVYRVTGRSPAELRIDPFDQNLVLLNSETVVEHGNRVYAWTNQGFVAVTESGVMRLSDPAIALDLLDIERDMLAATPTGMFAAASDTDDYVLFGLPANVTDGYCKKAYYLNTRTMAWTRWDFTETRTAGVEQQVVTIILASAALVDPISGLLTIAGGNGSKATLRKEVDSGNYTHADTATAVTINSVSGTSPAQTITIAGGSGWEPTVGDGIVQGGTVYGVVTARSSATVFTVASNDAFQAAAATTYNGITDTVQWAAKSGGAPGVVKHWLRGSLHFERLAQLKTATLTFASTQVPGEESVTFTRDTVTTSANPEEIDFMPTRTHSRATRLIPKFSLKAGGTRWALSGLTLEYTPYSTRHARAR